MNRLSRYNKVQFGLAAGLVVPVLTILALYLVRFGDLGLHTFLQAMITQNVLSPVLSLCVIPNLLVFFIFIWTDMLYLARGVLMATVIFAVVVAAVKYLL
jgi:hypothetical protein